MENLIYWTGCAALLVVALAVIIGVVWLTCIFVRQHIRDDLVSTYNHVQLRRLIKKISGGGYTKALEELKKEEI